MSIHFLNVDIPKKKNIEVALSYIYGIGRKEAVYICRKLGLNPKTVFGRLNDKAYNSLSNFIEFNYVHGFQLKRIKRQKIDFLVKLKSYRGIRLKQGLLVRGQKSRNKKTRRHF